MSSNTNEVTEQLLGCVKWFNNKSGYGFITVTGGTSTGKDIFVHHSAINVQTPQYKYLVQGEYVEFHLEKTTSGNHEYQATNVIGINGGQLMCETRNSIKLSMSNYKRDTKPEHEEEVESEVTPKQQRLPKVRGGGPREDTTIDVPVQKSSPKKKNSILATKKLLRKNSSISKEII